MSLSIFIYFENDEKVKVKGNRSVGLAVHRPSKHVVRTVRRLHCNISVSFAQLDIVALYH